MSKIKKYFQPLILLGVLLLASGCTNSDTARGNSEEAGAESAAEQNIEAFLENVFTGPNEENEFLFNFEDLEGRGERISEYYQDNFQPYMSESLLEDFINSNGAVQFLIAAHPDYVLATEEITLEENEDYYTFAAEVSYTNKESNESDTVTINGNIQTDEEGLVTGIQYHRGEYEEFRTALN
ncbi:hypothetical protein [Bacillus sp. SG-1]|uniref:hypothetical protein n=1 Tax=Bacillus sp. SG-1 TaxID=161544 RepID=UPI0001544219|nr:hypothetical protein [Bacillus sp. SG-1]EDL65738.1 hypothetical protein BSG1_12726 [Bacillus sp. SG-1]